MTFPLLVPIAKCVPLASNDVIGSLHICEMEGCQKGSVPLVSSKVIGSSYICEIENLRRGTMPLPSDKMIGLSHICVTEVIREEEMIGLRQIKGSNFHETVMEGERERTL